MGECEWKITQNHRHLWMGFPGSTSGEESLPMQETHEMQVQSLGQEDPLEEDKAPHSHFLAWTIPWTEEPGRLQSMRWQSQA